MACAQMAERQLAFTPRFNVAPTQQVDVILMERGDFVQKQMKWGWTHKRFGLITNAQAETARQKMFKESWATGNFGITAPGATETASEPLVDIITLRTIISVRI
jgi:putative SOS response-associated peptidase YedK